MNFSGTGLSVETTDGRSEDKRITSEETRTRVRSFMQFSTCLISPPYGRFFFAIFDG